MLELHCHTTFSDGTLTPTELVETAAAAGVRAIAITDHDTLSGWDEAIAAGKTYGLEIVPGVELSTVWGDRSLHILGFYPQREQLMSPLTERLEGRKRRAQRMLEALAELGYPLQLADRGEGMAPGRPHIASAMVAAGYVKTSQEAFDRFLGEGKPAYVGYEKFSAIEGIQLLRECGAVPVWAHPYLFQGGKVETTFHALLDAGLMGLEVYHPSHSPTQTKQLKAWCEQHQLVMTGGSDYHGPGPAGKGNHANQLNGFRIPLSLLDGLKAAVATVR
ncbi:PHP domain-containing protein [Leptolyngbya sp. AN02str]|uniref:PHP domain-containing protein n=1 Tax=Leptolyngbya sp. AN02str TaxID=3423363 RepID=UPI003D30F186